MSTKIILTADDYGANNFIDKGIIAGIQEGCINSVAAFVTFKDSEARIKQLVELQKAELVKGNRFAIGLHFSLTAGYPVIKEQNSLTYPHTGELIFRDAYAYPFEKIKEKEVQKELAAQIELLGQWLGGIDKIDHVSNHHGVTYLDSSIFKAYASQVKSGFDIPIRSPLNWSGSGLPFWDYDTLPSIPIGRQGIELGWESQLFETLPINRNKRINFAKKQKLVFPFCFADSIYGQPFVENLGYLVRQFKDPLLLNSDTKAAEMMFHLGYYEGYPENKSPYEEEETDGINKKYYPQRKLELQAIRSFVWNSRLTEMDIQKVTYRDLQA
jgi:predicted glycoside hydrolase/deacetylase ChbG (UPF0249 family)